MIQIVLFFMRGIVKTLAVVVLLLAVVCIAALITDGHGIWTGAGP